MVKDVLFLGLHQGRKTGVSKVQIELANALRSKGVTVDDLSILTIDGHDLTRSDGSTTHFNSVDDFLKYSSEIGKSYDVIHSHSWAWAPSEFSQGNIGDIKNYLSRSSPQLGVVHTFHSFIDSEYEAQKSIIGESDLVTLLSPASEPVFKDNFTIDGGSLPNTAIIPNIVNKFPVNDSDVQRIKSLYAPDGEKIILYVGRLEEQKGIYELSNAFNQINDNHPDTKLVVVGSSKPDYAGLFESKMQSILSNQINKGNVYFTGWLDEPSVAAYQRAADVQIAPSYTEAFGLAITRAVLNDCVPMISNLDTLDQIFHLNDSKKHLALSFDPYSVSDIVDTFDMYMANPLAYSGSMLDRGKQEFAQKYSLPAVVDMYLNAYDSVMKK